MDIAEFIKERNEAILSLDKDRILKYCQKYNVSLSNDEIIFWASVHKTVCSINTATEEQRKHSKQWLSEHGFSHKIVF